VNGFYVFAKLPSQTHRLLWPYARQRPLTIEASRRVPSCGLQKQLAERRRDVHTLRNVADRVA